MASTNEHNGRGEASRGNNGIEQTPDHGHNTSDMAERDGLNTILLAAGRDAQNGTRDENTQVQGEVRYEYERNIQREDEYCECEEYEPSIQQVRVTAMMHTAEEAGYNVFDVLGDGDCVISAAKVVLAAQGRTEWAVREDFLSLQNVEARDQSNRIRLGLMRRVEENMAKHDPDFNIDGESESQVIAGHKARIGTPRTTLQADDFIIVENALKVPIVTNMLEMSCNIASETVAMIMVECGHAMAVVKQGSQLCSTTLFNEGLKVWMISSQAYARKVRKGTSGEDGTTGKPWHEEVMRYCGCERCKQIDERNAIQANQSVQINVREGEPNGSTRSTPPGKNRETSNENSDHADTTKPAQSECTADSQTKLRPEAERMTTNGKQRKGTKPVHRNRSALKTNPSKSRSPVKGKEAPSKEASQNTDNGDETHVDTTQDDGTVETPSYAGIMRAMTKILITISQLTTVDNTSGTSDNEKLDALVTELYGLTGWTREQDEHHVQRHGHDTVLRNLEVGKNTKAARALDDGPNGGPVPFELSELEACLPLRSNELVIVEVPIGDWEIIEFGAKEILSWLEKPTRNLDSAGSDGIPLKMLHDFCKKTDTAAAILADVLTKIWTRMVQKRDQVRDLVATEVQPLGLPKPDLSKRFVGIGKAFTRVLHGVVMVRNRSDIAKELHSQNTTLAHSGTSKIVIVQQRMLDLDCTVILTDRTNAFNSVSMARSAEIFSQKKLIEPALLAAQLANHYVNTGSRGKILAQNIPQGSSIGTAAMAVVVDAALGETREAVKGKAICLSFADDVSVIAINRDEAERTVERCNEHLAKEGLRENMRKRKSHEGNSTGAISSLGAEIGSQSAIQESASKKLAGIGELVDELTIRVKGYLVSDGPVRQTCLRLLKMNIIPKAIHIMQNHCPIALNEALMTLDDKIMTCFEAIMNLTDDEASKNPVRAMQIRLPTSMGGFGLASLNDTCYMQRLGTLIRAMDFVQTCMQELGIDTKEILPEVTEIVDALLSDKAPKWSKQLQEDLTVLTQWNKREISPSEQQMKKLLLIQQKLTAEWHETFKAMWLAVQSEQSLDMSNRANSVCAPEAGRPLNVLTAIESNWMSDTEFLYFCRHRMFIPIIPKELKCCRSKGTIDERLDHAFSCKKLGPGSAHTHIKRGVENAMKSLVRYTGGKVKNEPSLLEWVNTEAEANQTNTAIGVSLRRGDVSISISSHAKREVVILDIRHCALTVNNAPTQEQDVGKAVTKGEDQKIAFYRKNFKFPKGVTMIPFTIDSYGKWGEMAKEYVEGVCSRIAGDDKRLHNKLISQTRETISVAHARGLGRTLARCVEECVHEADYHMACVSKNPGAKEAAIGLVQSN
jgi:hypothetical protein